MRKIHWAEKLTWLVLALFAANSYWLIQKNLWWLLPALLALAAAHLLPGRRLLTFDRLVICGHGIDLLIIFLIVAALSLPVQVTYILHLLPDGLWTELVYNRNWQALLSRNVLDAALTAFTYLCVVGSIFWHGIFCVYCTSVQLGIRYRLWGLLCAVIPVVNLVMLIYILRIASREIHTETEKKALNAQRHDEQICATKYPVLMVHGFFFRDSRILNYWGRIPSELEKNGANIFYGEHQSAAPIPESAAEITERVQDILRKPARRK